MIGIVIVNASTVLSDAEAAKIVPALQIWDDTMLRPAWGFEPCHYSFAPRLHPPAANDPRWPIYLNRHSTDPGALGWHDDVKGKVFGRVFVGDCLRYGISWTVDASHEAAEMRGDPKVDQFFTMADGRMTVHELCDAVEADELAIDVGGVKLSDFVLPAYFSTNGAGPFDYLHHLNGRCPTLTPGGYISIYEKGSWHQVTAMHLNGPPSRRSTRYHQSHRRRLLTEMPPDIAA